MTRPAIVYGLVLAIGSATADDKKDVPSELAPFQGTWKIVKVQILGEDNPKGNPSKGARGIFAGNKMTMKGGKEEGGKEESSESRFSVDPNKNPAELDVVDSDGNRSQWIYKFDKDGKLVICVELSFGKEPAPRPKSFDTKDTGYLVFVLEKVKE